ncbi:MAG: hypothetical protein LUI02_05980 [Clostridiales bacterium]|nr:hypothetical protein [Clostridiales bacterium]
MIRTEIKRNLSCIWFLVGIALIVAALWIIVFYGLAFYVMSRRTDVGER